MAFKTLSAGAVALLMVLASESLAANPVDSPALAGLRRGDYLAVVLRSGELFRLRLTGLGDESLVGLWGAISVHLQRADIAAIRRETPPDEVATISASTAALGLLGLTAASRGAAQNFGAGHACNGASAGC